MKCALFSHKTEEKFKVEQESDNFVDPFLDDYEEEEYEQEVDNEYDSEEKSNQSHNSNSNTNTNNNNISQESVENDGAAMPEHKLPFPSANNLVFEEWPEENVWANEKFGLEAVLQKTRSQSQKEDFETIVLENDQTKTLKNHRKVSASNNAAVDKTPKSWRDRKKSREEVLVSSEIKNIVLGNKQHIEMDKVVENIASLVPSNSKGKFFDINDNKNNNDDLLDEIFAMDYDSFLRKNENKPRNTKPAVSTPFDEVNALRVIYEESDSWYSNTNIPSFPQQFSGNV